MTHRYEFVDTCLDLWLNKEDYGIYNIVNTGSITTRQVVKLMKKYLKLDKDFKFWKNDEEFYGFGAKAPRSNCVLDNSKLTRTGLKIRDTEEAIIESLKYWTELK
jgi:UDP-glucose 4,6-dehydratase